MPVIRTRGLKRNKQPQGAVEVNGNIPAPFSVLVPEGSQFRRVTVYDPVGTYAGNSVGVISSGTTVKFTRVSGDGYQSVTRSLTGNDRTTYSFLAHFQAITTGANQTIFGARGGLQVRLNSTNKLELLTQGVALRGTSTQSYGDGQPHTVGVTCVTGGSTRVLCDGREVITYGGTIDIGSSDETYTTIAKRGGTGEEFNGHIGLFANWSGLAFPDLVQDLTANPWQIFAPIQRKIFVLGVAAGGVIEADASSVGTSTVTGVSGATAGSAGASTGTATATGDAGSINAGVAESAGIATTSGVAAAVTPSDASSAGAAIVTGLSGTVVAAVASSAGTSTASADAENAGTGATIIEATASAVGASTASGVSGAIAGSVAEASGVASADGVSGATVGTVGSSSGQATANGVGADGAILEVVSANPFSQEVEIRRFYMRKGKKLLMFDSVAEAEAYTEAEALADEAIAKAHKTSRLARKRLRTRIVADAVPAQTIDTDWLAGMMERFAINLDLPTLLAEQDYERIMQVHAMAMAMQDDEDDVELLLMWG